MGRSVFALLLTTYAVGVLSQETQATYEAQHATVPESDFAEMLMPPVPEVGAAREEAKAFFVGSRSDDELVQAEFDMGLGYGHHADTESAEDGSPYTLPSVQADMPGGDPLAPVEAAQHSHFLGHDYHDVSGSMHHQEPDFGIPPPSPPAVFNDRFHRRRRSTPGPPAGDMHGSDMYGSDMYGNDIHDEHDSPPPPVPVEPDESGSGDMTDHLGSGPGGYGHHHYHHHGIGDDGHEFHGTEMHGAEDSHPDDYEGAMEHEQPPPQEPLEDSSPGHHPEGAAREDEDECSAQCGPHCDACAEPCDTPFSAACKECVTEQQCQDCYDCHMHGAMSGGGEQMPAPGLENAPGSGNYQPEPAEGSGAGSAASDFLAAAAGRQSASALTAKEIISETSNKAVHKKEAVKSHVPLRKMLLKTVWHTSRKNLNIMAKADKLLHAQKQQKAVQMVAQKRIAQMTAQKKAYNAMHKTTLDGTAEKPKKIDEEKTGYGGITPAQEKAFAAYGDDLLQDKPDLYSQESALYEELVQEVKPLQTEETELIQDGSTIKAKAKFGFGAIFGYDYGYGDTEKQDNHKHEETKAPAAGSAAGSASLPAEAPMSIGDAMAARKDKKTKKKMFEGLNQLDGVMVTKSKPKAHKKMSPHDFMKGFLNPAQDIAHNDAERDIEDMVDPDENEQLWQDADTALQSMGFPTMREGGLY